MKTKNITNNTDYINSLIQENESLRSQLEESCQEKDILADALEKSFEEISLLHKIGDIVCLNQKPSEYINKIIQDLIDVIACENILLFWHKAEKGSSELDMSPEVFQAGNNTLNADTVEVIWDIAAIVTNSKQLYTIENDFNRNSSELKDSINNFIVTGIQGKEGPIGAIAAINKTENQNFGTIEARMMTSIANKLSNCHENQSLYLQQRELMMGTLRALVRSIDAKDPYTCGHSERVAEISKFIANEIKLSETEIEDAYMAGLLHDIGKIGVSGSTLRKAARLTEDEYNEVKVHPQIGADILKGIKQMAVVINAVMTHHERYDGKGYPFGLSGNNIPLIGRIVNIADTFDAMISSRPYRESMPVSKVLYEISRYSGTQFDPELSEIILKSDISALLTALKSTDKRVDAERNRLPDLNLKNNSKFKIPDISGELYQLGENACVNYIS